VVLVSPVPQLGSWRVLVVRLDQITAGFSEVARTFPTRPVMQLVM